MIRLALAKRWADKRLTKLYDRKVADNLHLSLRLRAAEDNVRGLRGTVNATIREAHAFKRDRDEARAEVEMLRKTYADELAAVEETHQGDRDAAAAEIERLRRELEWHTGKPKPGGSDTGKPRPGGFGMAQYPPVGGAS